MQDEQSLRNSAQKARDRANAERQTLEQNVQRMQQEINVDMNNAGTASDPKEQQDWSNAAQTKQAELARMQSQTEMLIAAAEKEAQNYDSQADQARQRKLEEDEKNRAAELLAAQEAARQLRNAA